MCAHLLFFGTFLSFSSSFHGKHRRFEAEFFTFFFSKWLTKKWLHDPKEEEEEEEEESSLSFFFCAFGATIFFPFFFFMACNFKSHKALLKLSTASHGHRERR